MGFNSVYKSLQELFPQIDSRVLRAVAIEHSKDPDAAVEDVLEEIIPFFTERSRPSSPLSVTSLTGTSQASDNKFESQQCLHASDDNHDSESKISESVHSHYEPVVLVDKILNTTLPDDESEVSEAESSTISVSKSTGSYSGTLSGNVTDFNLENHQSLNVGVSEILNAIVGTSEKSLKEKSSAHGENSLDKPASLSIHDPTLSTSDYSILCTEQPEMQEGSRENTESSNDTSIISTTREVIGTDYEPTFAELDTSSEVVGTSYGCNLDSSLSRSSQIHIVDVIDQSITAAKDNKKILFSAMEAVINLMKQLENKEQAAELARKEAAMGGADIQDKVEELRKMLQHAKATNDMHAGEIYGERAILTTELRELQSRVLSLSDEKDKSLAVLYEMRQALQVRVAAAEDKIKDAERERLEKEECARNALAEQELVMEKVVQEANLLKQQSEENAKLQELLLDRGHVLDVMQGELAVIYQDVRLLKENFDENVPFSKSVSSSQTSCKLASSSSSLRSPVSELETETCLGLENQMDDTNLEFDIPMNNQGFVLPTVDPTVQILEPQTDELNNSDKQIGENKASKDAHEALDDEWQVLDNEFEGEIALS